MYTQAAVGPMPSPTASAVATPACEGPAASESNLFSPDAILPEQFYHLATGTPPVTGPQALMSAMLEDAVLCFQKALIAPGKRTNRLAREAEAWLFSEDEHWPFSFLNVCAVLGIDPHYFRKGLLQWRQRRLQRLQGKTTQRIPAPQEYKTAA